MSSLSESNKESYKRYTASMAAANKHARIQLTLRTSFFLVLLTLMGLAIYAIIYYTGSGSNDKNAKLYVGLSGVDIIITFLFFVYMIHS